MSRKDEYVEKLKAQLDEWSADIDVLKAKADKAEAKVRQEYQEQIAALREHQKAARSKLEELRKASDAAWEDLKAGAEGVWSELSQAVKSASSKFK